MDTACVNHLMMREFVCTYACTMGCCVLCGLVGDSVGPVLRWYRTRRPSGRLTSCVGRLTSCVGALNSRGPRVPRVPSPVRAWARLGGGAGEGARGDAIRSGAKRAVVASGYQPHRDEFRSAVFFRTYYARAYVSCVAFNLSLNWSFHVLIRTCVCNMCRFRTGKCKYYC